MNRLTYAILFTFATCSIGSASEIATISFTGLPVTDMSSSYSTTHNSTYNGVSTATIDGISSQSIVCDDFLDTTNFPSGPFNFTIETLASLSGVDFTSGYAKIKEGSTTYTLTTVQAYETAAVLVSDIEALKPNTTSNQQLITDYQYAIWDLMAPGAYWNGISDSSDSTTTADLQTAFAAVLTPTAATITAENDLVIYTPDRNTNQEFLGLSTPTPEPASWALASLLGLLLCVPRLRSRVRSAILSRS